MSLIRAARKRREHNPLTAHSGTRLPQFVGPVVGASPHRDNTLVTSYALHMTHIRLKHCMHTLHVAFIPHNSTLSPPLSSLCISNCNNYTGEQWWRRKKEKISRTKQESNEIKIKATFYWRNETFCKLELGRRQISPSIKLKLSPILPPIFSNHLR